MRTAAVQHITVTEDALIVDLTDGRTVSEPLVWYPRLQHGQPEERGNWRLIGQREGYFLSPGLLGSPGARRDEQQRTHEQSR
jgi:hypothetical protein